MKLIKKSAIALAVGAVMSAPVLAEDSGPKVYGKIAVTLDRAEVEDKNNLNAAGVQTQNEESRFELNSNASRLGIKGEKDLDAAGLSAFYKLEYEVYVDDGDKGGNVFGQRNIYGGIKGGFGAIQAGKFDTPVKKSQGKFDQFGDLTGDIKNVMSGEARSSDLIQYTSPKIMDAITVKLALQPGEESDSEENCKTTRTACDDNGVADGRSASITFKQDGIYASLAMGKDLKDDDVQSPLSTTDAKKLDIKRFVAAYKASNFQVALLAQQAEDAKPAPGAKAEMEDALALSAYFKLNKQLKLKAQYAAVEVDEQVVGEKADENTQLTLGADYKLSKKTKALAYFTKIEKDTKEPNEKVEKESVFGLGLEHKF